LLICPAGQIRKQLPSIASAPPILTLRPDSDGVEPTLWANELFGALDDAHFGWNLERSKIGIGQLAATPHRQSRILVRRNASQFAGAPGAVCCESLFRKRIKPAGPSVPFGGGVELLCVEGLEPCAKPRQLARGKLFDGLLDVLGGSHASDIALERHTEKGAEHGACEDRKPVGRLELLAKPITCGAVIDGYRFRLRSLSYGGRAAQPILRAAEFLHENVQSSLGACSRDTSGLREDDQSMQCAPQHLGQKF
jgi:hypothetical protein